MPGQIEVNGVPMSYLDDGRGEPVVFLHGAAVLFVFWLILFWMYRQRILIRI